MRRSIRKRLRYTGYYENFNVPTGVKYLTITASGASGGGGSGQRLLWEPEARAPW